MVTPPAERVAASSSVRYSSPVPLNILGSTCLAPLRTRALAAAPEWPSSQADTWGDEEVVRAVAGTAAVADRVVAASAMEPATTRPRSEREGYIRESPSVGIARRATSPRCQQVEQTLPRTPMDTLFRDRPRPANLPGVDALDSWTRSEHTSDVEGRPTTHPVWRKGTGPGVIVVHEMPGLTNGVI